MHNDSSSLPHVPVWNIVLLRISYALIAGVMGSIVWHQLIFESAGWPVARGLSKAMLGSLALMSLWGIRYPVRMLPLMLYELIWKTVWIGVIFVPAWYYDRASPDLEGLFWDCIGVLFVYIAVPWRYVWNAYFCQPTEPWRNKRHSADLR